MNKLSTHYVDRKRLAALVTIKRRELGLPQKEIAMRAGVNPNYISLIENARLGFKSPEHLPMVKKVTKFLGIEVPYLTDNSEEEPESISVKSFDELKDVLERRNSEPEPKLPPKVDAELYVIQRCGKELEKIESVRGRSRIINYLEDKYVLAHVNNETEENDE